nr:hypothetical protein [Pedobacter sp. ASV2]
MNIQVLWVDDEFKEDFVSFAEQEGIDIHHKKSAQEGKDELQKNYNSYHAVILDAKGILDKDDQVTNLQGLRVIRDFLNEFNANNYLPYFIFTGQPDYQNNEVFKQSYGDFFTKGRDEQSLINKIKDCVLKKDEYIIQKRYSKVFEAIDCLLDKEIHRYLTDLLVSIHHQQDDIDDKLHFTQIRIILESLFRVANKVGLLHNKCIIEGKVNLTEASLFLAGEETKYIGVKSAKPHFPKLISNAVKDILFITGAASHTADPETDKNINLHEYRSQLKTPYLLFSLTFQLFDIIIWFNEYLKANNDYVKNVAQWRDLQLDLSSNFIAGIVSRIAENGYGTFLPENDTKTLSIIPQKIREFSLVEGQKISVQTEKKLDKVHIIQIEI